MQKPKQWVVICENTYGHESGYTVSEIIGPFGEAEAREVADNLLARDEYGQDFSVTPLVSRTDSYILNRQ